MGTTVKEHPILPIPFKVGWAKEGFLVRIAKGTFTIYIVCKMPSAILDKGDISKLEGIQESISDIYAIEWWIWTKMNMAQ